MNVRLLDWRDLPALHRNQNESVFLDTPLVLTRGAMLIPGALVSALAPSMGVFTCIANGDNDAAAILGQCMHFSGKPFAHLTFLTPRDALNSAATRALIEYMLVLSGERGALRMLAEVDEGSPAFETLRRSAFSIYTRQRIWRLDDEPPARFEGLTWRPAGAQDELPVRILYNSLVPGLVQQIEPFATQRPKGMVYYGQGELLAYVDLKYGLHGIWAQPFVHPDAADMTEHFLDLLCKIPNRRARPVHVCIRSYQAWLESAVEELGAEAGPRQAVMAKNLSAPIKARQGFAIPALEGGQPEMTAPVAQLESK